MEEQVKRYLVILEVSQKQAYVFSSNKLQDNVRSSEEIAYVTSPAYFAQKYDGFNKEKNLVYSGGGHIVLEFASREEAVDFNRKISYEAIKDYPDMELFISVMPYDENETPGENLKKLTGELEKKKSIRRSSFYQRDFGIEKIDSFSLKAVRKEDKNVDTPKGINLVPEGFTPVLRFEDLGGSEGESSFIAIVHIDGNGMGKRVTKLYKELDAGKSNWEEYKNKIKEFSDCIDSDFKSAYKEMENEVADSIMKGDLTSLSLKDNNFPVRSIIMSGDDICFVSEGRIGIECAKLFIEKLRAKTNTVDNSGYEACAGVAIVHRKYPFFRAYELAESLCSNAKRFCAAIDTDNNGALISAIDWHISFGELADNTEEIRKQYLTGDGNSFELRPLIIDGAENLIGKETIRRYSNFRNLYKLLTDKEETYARSTLKQMRNVLKQGEVPAWNYIRFHKIDDMARRCYYNIFEEKDTKMIGSGDTSEGHLFVETYDKKKRCILFDAIEIMDSMLLIGG